MDSIRSNSNTDNWVIEGDLVDADMRGIRALRDETTDTVLFWYEECKDVLQFDPETPPPVVIEMPEPWDTNPPLNELIRELAAKRSGGQTTAYLFEQQQLLDYMKERDHADVASGGLVDDGRDRLAAAGGGSAVVSGGPEDGDTVGESREADVDPDRGQTSSVSGGSDSGEAVSGVVEA